MQQTLSEQPATLTPDQLAEIERFAVICKEKRKDAIDGRRASGIEKQWYEDECHYEGEDSNEGELEKGRTTLDSPRETRKKTPGKSSVFVNITRPYCDAAAARVSDILLPTDDRNWALRATPKPNLIKEQAQPAQAVQPTQQPPGMLSKIGSAIGGMFGGQAAPNATLVDVNQPVTDQATAAAKRAQTVIDDWLVECGYQAEIRKLIECSSRLGVGILKGPHPTIKQVKAVSQTQDGWKMKMEAKVVATSKFVNPWNFYPDPNCGQYVKDGSYTCERDDITAYALRKLKGGDYIDEMIDVVLEEGPIKSTDGAKQKKEGTKTSDKDLFEIWYIHCNVSKKEMEAAGCPCSQEELPAIVTMVNDRIIKITMSPLDSGEFPYDVMVWQEKLNHWAGIGVARHIRACQKGLNSSVRALQDNASASSGPQYILDTSKIEPADGKWTPHPHKYWRKKLGAEDITDVRQTFTIISIETRQVELLNIINYWTKTAEDVTGLPMLLQGQQGQAPDTLGATQIINNNGSTVLRRIARTYDDRITVPHIGRYYEWLLLRPGNEDAKGEFQVEARGSSALVERDLQNLAVMKIMGMSLDPAYELDPVKMARETLKSMRLDPKSFALDEAQKKARQAQPAMPPIPIAVAQIHEKGLTEREQMKAKEAADHTAAEAALTMEEAKINMYESEQDRQIELMAFQIQERLQSMKEGVRREISLNDIKSMLAQVKMKLSVTKDLATAQHTVDLHKHRNPAPKQVISPVIEPAGRAQPGKSFQQ